MVQPVVGRSHPAAQHGVTVLRRVALWLASGRASPYRRTMSEPPLAHPLQVVAVSGSLHAPSKTTALVNEILAALSREVPIGAHLIQVSDIGPEFAGTLCRDELPASVEDELLRIESADVLVVASPVYRASFTGLFKHLFDFVDQYALVEPRCCWPRPVAATVTLSSSSTSSGRCSAFSRRSPCRSGSTRTTPISPITECQAWNCTSGSTRRLPARCR